MRLIDADALISMPWVLPSKMSRRIALECFHNIVNDATTIDAEPVRHCHWCKPEHEICGTCKAFFDYNNDGGSDKCSSSYAEGKCTGYKPVGYCPNCGAKIDVEVQDG